jgi:hypothetical protein
MNFSTVENRFWPVSAPNRPIAIFWPRRITATPTPGVWHLLDVAQQGLKPDYTIADAGQGLRAGQKVAWGDTPCHGDVFHIIRQCEGLANTLSRLAKGATSRREKLEAKFGCAGRSAPKVGRVAELALARQAESRARDLARGIRTLIQWLSHDVLALAGPPGYAAGVVRLYYR